MGKFRQCLTELSAHDTIMAGHYKLVYLSSFNRREMLPLLKLYK